jgi:hypothetical protein
MKAATLVSGLCLSTALALAATAADAADAPHTYYAGASIVSGTTSIPVFWNYDPTTNLIKLCYQTTSTSTPLACTPGKSALAGIPSATDDLQYRLSAFTATGALWILDVTSNKAALCQATYTVSTTNFTFTCTQGSGIS